MNESLTEIIELSRNDEFKTIITLDQILRAKEIIANEPKSSDEIFKVLCSMNLINAAIKSKEFKEVIFSFPSLGVLFPSFGGVSASGRGGFFPLTQISNP